MSILDLLATLKDAEHQLLESHPAIDTVPYNGLAQRSSDRIYLNSAGACRQQQLTTASLYLYARAEEAGRKPRSAGAVRLAYGAGDLDIAGCIEEAAGLTSPTSITPRSRPAVTPACSAPRPFSI